MLSPSPERRQRHTKMSHCLSLDSQDEGKVSQYSNSRFLRYSNILGVCAGMGPVLACPWGISIDTDGNVLVADWGEQHRVLLYPAQGVGWPIVTQGLSSPRGLALLPEGQLAVSDSMHHCIKIYQYKANLD
uniref:NHL repeat containing 4 n=1 Tax=Monopterus albus TaxID=43700 RepID=A0A3Q3JDW6_MONAL